MADKDTEVHEVALEIQLAILTEYRDKRQKMTGPEKGSALTEVSAINRTIAATAPAHTFFSPTALISALGDGELAGLQKQSSP